MQIIHEDQNKNKLEKGLIIELQWRQINAVGLVCIRYILFYAIFIFTVFFYFVKFFSLSSVEAAINSCAYSE